MTTIAAWPARAETWLDERGKGAWIVATVLAFILFWPLGLALLAYMIWSKRMFAGRCGKSRHHDRSWAQARRHGFRSSGNTAFDAYKADTLDRLEREQDEFEAFLKRLRDSKDKSEFDQYLDERARAARDQDGEGEAKDEGRGAY
ncbi:MAG: DUF2852 domain-containing protein [Paracoccaceae bacterium]